MIEFKSLDLSSKTVFEEYTKNKYENSETSFANLFIWRDYFDTRYAVTDDFLVVLYTAPDGKYYSYMPYGNGNLKDCTEKLLNYFESCNQKLSIVSATLPMAEKLKELYPNIEVLENINFNDYIYLSQSLINLSGKKLHSKKNHLNKFKSTYKYVYKTMEKSDYGNCIDLAAKLMKKNRNENSLSYKAEYKSLENTFNNFEYLNLEGGIIEIENKLCAFSVGEKLTDDVALIHIEKADTDYTGIYAAINNEFVKNCWSGFEFINREEDMGIEGLRKAKMSYKPDHMVRKFLCNF